MKLVQLFSFVCVATLSSTCFGQSGDPSEGRIEDHGFIRVPAVFYAEPTELEYVLFMSFGSGGGRVVMSSPDREDLEGPARRLMRMGLNVEIQVENVQEPEWKLLMVLSGSPESIAEGEAIVKKLRRMGYLAKIGTVSPSRLPKVSR